MTKLQSARPKLKRQKSPNKKSIRQLVESSGIQRLSLDQYRSHIRQIYDGPAGAVLAVGSMLSLHEPLIGRVLRTRRFDVSRSRSILDVGSGAGQILGHLLKTTQSQTKLAAFDLSPRMLVRARNRLKNRRPRYVAGDMLQMPFADGAFDCVTCGWVIEHLPDPVPGLREVGRVLKPGGSALILTTEDTLSGAVVSRTWNCRTYNRDELQRACLDAGLEWTEELWFTRVHRFFKMGGILVEATKPEIQTAKHETQDKSES